eukprot:GHVR01096485.1.p1 GENE.GHVR01096485.1~~GHVR01096485.1.p1  ORF type:complete len:101 (-),score=20.71 GHVR01096485.1:38-340(-)
MVYAKDARTHIQNLQKFVNMDDATSILDGQTHIFRNTKINNHTHTHSIKLDMRTYLQSINIEIDPPCKTKIADKHIRNKFHNPINLIFMLYLCNIYVIFI